MKDEEQATKKYFSEMARIRESCKGTSEESFYPPLTFLLNEIGRTMTSSFDCVSQPKSDGEGHPDFVLLGRNRASGDMPEHGAVEAKALQEDVSDPFKGAYSNQMRKYLDTYNLLTVTNYREFRLFRRGASGDPELLEVLTIAESEERFWEIAVHPHSAALNHGARIWEFLRRSMAYSASISRPKDVAWFLASYAREALAIIENAKDESSKNALESLRASLENGIDRKFDGEDGNHLFCSSLVQTLFYGMFSAWAAQAREGSIERFDYRTAGHAISMPVIQALFDEMTKSSRVRRLGSKLEDVLERAVNSLNRIDQDLFFENFGNGENLETDEENDIRDKNPEAKNAIQHFYQPFLSEFDSKLQSQMGVWYTPPEVVKYMVERVDTVLRNELGIEDGLANEEVYVLDPCCGTGAYVIEVLRKIEEIYRSKRDNSLVGQHVKKAAVTRVRGFELMPAPFVIAQMQIVEYLKSLDVTLSRDERLGVFLTNALTGWTERSERNNLFPDLQDEYNLASNVKLLDPILVVIGNPPYNAYAGTAPVEEGDLTRPYKTLLKESGKASKSNLDELYVKFFRVAEMRIEKNTRGVVAYITSDSWLSGRSFTGMRQHILNNFDKMWIEGMRGNVFKMEGFSSGITLGVATSLLVKDGSEEKNCVVRYRDDINLRKPEDTRKHLLDSLVTEQFDDQYQMTSPEEWNCFLLRPSDGVHRDYKNWPMITEICKPTGQYQGMHDGRGWSLSDISKSRLAKRIEEYLDPSMSWDDFLIQNPDLTRVDKVGGVKNLKRIRETVLEKEGYDENMLFRYAMRPFDTQWGYYSCAWNRPRPDMWKRYYKDSKSMFLISHGHQKGTLGYPASFSTKIGDQFHVSDQTSFFPFRDRMAEDVRRPDDLDRLFEHSLISESMHDLSDSANLSEGVLAWISALGLDNPDQNVDVSKMPWLHILAICYSPEYIRENEQMLRTDWPRVPLPNCRDLLEESSSGGG